MTGGPRRAALPSCRARPPNAAGRLGPNPLARSPACRRTAPPPPPHAPQPTAATSTAGSPGTGCRAPTRRECSGTFTACSTRSGTPLARCAGRRVSRKRRGGRRRLVAVHRRGRCRPACRRRCAAPLPPAAPPADPAACPASPPPQIHTHEFSPPIDTCGTTGALPTCIAPSPFFDRGEGTIMSYVSHSRATPCCAPAPALAGHAREFSAWRGPCRRLQRTARGDCVPRRQGLAGSCRAEPPHRPPCPAVPRQ